MTEHIYDVVIIGGGPAGLSCAVYAARARLSTLVLDRAATAGALASATKIANWPGIETEVSGMSILEKIRAQAEGFGAEIVKGAAMAVDFSSDIKQVYTAEDVYKSKSVVVATGATGKQSTVEGEEELAGRGVGYCVTCDAAFFSEREAAVVGHNEIAAEEALFLARFASKVYVVCDKHAMTGPSELLEELEETPNLEILTGLKLKRINGSDSVDSIEVEDHDGNVRPMAVSGVFILSTGRSPITGFLGDSVKLTENGCVDVAVNFRSSVEGVYAVGDVTCLYPKQGIIASSEGVIAALEIDRFLSGRERARTSYH